MQASLSFDACRAAIFTLVVAGGGASFGCGAASSPVRSAETATLYTQAVPIWTTTLGRGDPLVGKIWDARGGAFVPAETLTRAAASADFVLLGEKHDNPDHHALQAWVIGSMVFASMRPAVLLEMLEPSQDPVVAAYHGPAAGLGEALAWDKSGWPPWSTYEPIASVALGARLRIASANLARDEVRSIAHRGIDGLAHETVARLGLDRPEDPAREASLEDELRESHCGQLPDAMLAPMALAQRARDAQMADRLLASQGPAVLIAGAGHTRDDRGAAVIVRARRPSAHVVSVAFVEVDEALAKPEQYAARYHATRIPFDFVWFTPRANDDDPCADFHVHAAPK